MKKKNKEEGKTVETPLPEEVIQHIQSFMSPKEAARSAIISKSWYYAWLTRPAIDLDERDFGSFCSKQLFSIFVEKTIQRYENLNLKIRSLRLRSRIEHPNSPTVFAHTMTKNSISSDTAFVPVENLIARAMKLGATDVEIELPIRYESLYLRLSLPPEVLACETLVRLSIIRSRLNGNYFIRCSRLKSLTLDRVTFRTSNNHHPLKDLTTFCISLEELSVSKCSGSAISRVNLNALHKLRRLYLCSVIVDSSFFSDFASRFPCLNDLSVVYCLRCTSISIASTSLETISYKSSKGSYRAEFDVPNIRKFTYASSGLPSKVCVNGALQEWEFDVLISIKPVPEKTWFSNLKRLVENQFKRSRVVSLAIRLVECRRSSFPEPKKADLEKAEPKPLVVDNLRIIDTRWSCALLVRLFGSFQPKMITHCLHSNEAFSKMKKRKYYEKEALDMLCQKLMRQVISPNCGVPDQDMFGKFGPKRVNVEAMDKFGEEWRPLALEEPLDVATIPVVNKRKVRFHLIWD